MRVLVYPHATGIGGSQLNAVEIAAAVRDAGHHVIVVSRPGPLVDIIGQLGLPHVTLDERASRRPSARAAAQLTELARSHRCDVVHGYEWPPGIEAFAGPGLRLRLPVICTVMSSSVAPFLPRTMPLIVGTSQIKDAAVGAGHPHVTLLEPPVDTRLNAPGEAAGSFASDLGLRAGPSAPPLVVIVSRLAPELKLEGLLAACDAAGELACGGTELQLAIVGDGQARPLVEQAAELANARAGRTVVRLAGLMIDPRPAYRAADIVVGMGGSALRGMAFAKPVVVQGEHGFCELVTARSAPVFARQGFFGLGPPGQGRPEAAAKLAGILRALLADPATRLALGQFSRSLVVSRYSLERAAELQLAAYTQAVAARQAVSGADLAADAGRAGLGVARHKAVRKLRRWRGTAAADDFNTVARMRTGGLSRV
jgi:glycosyltransferase involved in cell wall biosynthesis